MKCPVCGGNTRVLDTHLVRSWKKRLRCCRDVNCQYVFATYEIEGYELYKRLKERFPDLKEDLLAFTKKEFPHNVSQLRYEEGEELN